METLFDLVDKWLNGSPHWLVPALVGAVFSALLTPMAPFVFGIVTWPIRRLRMHWIEGIWFHYFFNFDPDKPELKSEAWRIRKGIRHRFVVYAKSRLDAEPQYIGHLYFEREFAMLRLQAKGHDEEVFQRFSTPVPSRSDMHMVGMSIAQDYTGRSSAGANILSRVALEEKTVREILKSKVQQDSSCRVMRVLER